MKKILTTLLLSLAILVTGCEEPSSRYKVNYKLTYKIHYPSYVAEKTYMFKGTDNATATLQSDDGTNYILIMYAGKPNTFGPGEVFSTTTAPIEIVSLEKVY